jgi:hypothetical protein
VTLAPRVVVVHRRTEMEQVVAGSGTLGQARFRAARRGRTLAEVEQGHSTQEQALQQVAAAIPPDWRRGEVERADLDRFVFGPEDVIVVVGQDGLVANVAKYVGAQPIVGVNPDPERIDGVLLPFGVDKARVAVRHVLEERAHFREVTLAEVVLSDGQRLLGFNDLFLGARTHVSARYTLQYERRTEAQSSSGIIVSTGAGSSGWLSSVFTLARGLTEATGGQPGQTWRLDWEDPRLAFVVREPFISRHSAASMVAGFVSAETALEVESRMPSGGVIFSDGVEEDFLAFNAGTTARVHPAAQRARLVVA